MIRVEKTRLDQRAPVSVFAPRHIRDDQIQAFLKQNVEWIRRKITEVRRAHDSLGSKRFASGEEFLFLGRKHRLEVRDHPEEKSRVGFDGRKWDVSLPAILPHGERPGRIRKELVSWYQGQAREILAGRVFHYARLMGLTPKNITVKAQKTIWGSCHYRRRTINLNWKIIMAPFPVIDYVVVHELCHLKVPNHSPMFWRKVEDILPDYRERKKWFKANAPNMALP